MKPLTIDRQKAMRFGGNVEFPLKVYGSDFNPENYLKNLSEKHFKIVFHEWMIQCWLYDYPEQIPTEQEDLSVFEIQTLIPKFKQRYIDGDWKRLSLGSGATIDEMVLCWQMENKMKITVLFNKGQKPPQYLPEAATYYFVDGEVLTKIYFSFINGLSAQNEGMGYRTLVSDGQTHHVLATMYHFAEDKLVAYEDNVGENNTCFLNKGNNALHIDSQFIGFHKDRRTRCWYISESDFLKVFYAVPLFNNLSDFWNYFSFEHFKNKIGLKL